MSNQMKRVLYLASFVLLMTTSAGLVWLNLLNSFLREAGNPIPMARELSVVLAALVISMVAYMIHVAKGATGRVITHEAKQ